MIKINYLIGMVAIMHLLTSACIIKDESDNIANKLTGKKWMFGEIRFLEKNEIEIYDENGNTNTQNFKKDYIIFNKDHTGEYSNGLNTYMITSWEITDSRKIKLEYVIAMENPITVYWDNIRIKSNSIQYSEYYKKSNGINVMGFGSRIAIKK